MCPAEGAPQEYVEGLGVELEKWAGPACFHQSDLL